MWFKWLSVPVSNEQKQIEVVQTWEVRWQSRYGEFSQDTQPELECFTSEDEAITFAQSLRNAFALIRHTSGNKVCIRKKA